MNKPTTRRDFLQTLGVAAAAGAGLGHWESQQASGANATSEGLPRLDSYGDPLPDGVRARMGSGRLRLGRTPDCLVYSPDGRLIACGAGDVGIDVWDSATGRRVRHFELAGEASLDFAFSPDSATLTCVGGKAPAVECRVLDIVSGAELRRIGINDAFTLGQAFVATGGGLVAVVGIDGNLRVYDVARGKETVRFPVKAFWQDSAISFGGELLALTDHRDTIYVYESATSKLVTEIKRVARSFFRAAFSHDRRLLAASCVWNGTTDTGIVIWDIATGKRRQELTGTHSDWISRPIRPLFSPDDRLLATISSYGDLVLWNVNSGSQYRRVRTGCSLIQAAFSPDGKTVAAASSVGAVVQWEVRTGRLLPASAYPLSEVRGLSFTHDDKRVVGEASELTEDFIEWNTGTGRETRRFARPRPGYAALSPDRTLIAWNHPPDRTVQLRDAATGREVASLKGHKEGIVALTFSPDGQRLFSGSYDQTIRVWEVPSGRLVKVLRSSGPRPSILAVSEDGRWLASAGEQRTDEADRNIRLWDLAATGDSRRLTPPRGIQVSCITFSPDSCFLAIGGRQQSEPNQRGMVLVWDRSNCELLQTLEADKEVVYSVAFSPDSRMLAVGGSDDTIRVWELASEQERRGFKGYRGMVHGVAFSRDGRLLAGSPSDAPVFVWDVVPALAPRPNPTLGDLDRLWSCLAGADAVAAFEAVTHLASYQDQSLPYIQKQTKPATALDVKRLAELVRQLDSARFEERKTAAAELERLGPQAAASLERAQHEPQSLEVRQRLREIIRRLKARTPERLRTVRVVEALEAMNSPTAAEFLRELAAGAPDAPLTREAASACERLRDRRG